MVGVTRVWGEGARVEPIMTVPIIEENGRSQVVDPLPSSSSPRDTISEKELRFGSDRPRRGSVFDR